MSTKTPPELERSGKTEVEDDDDCKCADLGGDFPCWDCYRNGATFDA